MRHVAQIASAIIALGAGATVIGAGPARAQVTSSDPCQGTSGYLCTEWKLPAGSMTWDRQPVSTSGVLGAECIDIPAPAPGAVAIAMDNETGAVAQAAIGSCALPVPLPGDEVVSRTVQELLIPDSGMPVLMFW